MLCSEVTLHFDCTCHGGEGSMGYDHESKASEGLENGGPESEGLSSGMEAPSPGEEQEDKGKLMKEDVNLAAYEGPDSDAFDVSEPAGVVHLVHGWIQQNQPAKVSPQTTCPIIHFYFPP